MTSILLSTLYPFNQTIVSFYLCAELLFFVSFYVYLLPRANRRKSPDDVEDYRDYGQSRSKLLERILDRIEQHSKRNGTSYDAATEEFLGNWFSVLENSFDDSLDSKVKRALQSSPDSTATDDEDDEWQTIDRMDSELFKGSFLRRGDTDCFFAWAFFGKSHDALLKWEKVELESIYTIIEQRTKIKIGPDGTTPGVKPMRLTLDDIKATYRPLIVYGLFASIGLIGAFVLRCCGFRHYTSRSGLTYWHRDGAKDTDEEDMPLLFNHGIAPGGLALYLPMVLCGFGPFGKHSKDRMMILFENHPITFRFLGFHAVCEDAYINGVEEAIEKHIGADQLSKKGLAIVGHSFGSCQVTWMLRCNNIRGHVRQVVLLDPVSLVLSEPDVMTNFLYAGRDSSVGFVGSLRPILLFPFYYILDLISHPASRERMSREMQSASSSFRSYSSYSSGKPGVSGRYNKIWMVQSELWIEHYLRRNFFWYNSELWLEDIPPEVRVIIAILGKDEILNASKVHTEARCYQEKSSNNVHIIHWSGAGHAYCVPRPWTWHQIRSEMEQDTISTNKKEQ